MNERINNVIPFPQQQTAVQVHRGTRAERSFLAFWLILLTGGSLLGGLLNLLGL